MAPQLTPTASPLQSPHPLEVFAPLDGLDGRWGANRAGKDAVPQLAANNDLEAIRAWLDEFAKSPNTWRAYRREAERLLSWALIERGVAFSSLSREDLQAYEAFLADPAPVSRWCGPRRPRIHPAWRPFQGPLDPSSRRQALVILNGLFNYLVQARYLAGNPLGLARRIGERRATWSGPDRHLDGAAWAYVWAFLEGLPVDTPKQRAHQERLRFVLAALYLLGARATEFATHTMGSIHRHRGRWWWRVLGKGRKDERIPVNSALLEALRRYRESLGLPALPDAGETRPLLLDLAGRRGLTPSALYRIVKSFFAAAARASPDPDMSQVLERASPHWLRHTSVTHQADAGIELRYINRSARHAKLETTGRYLHADDAKWHAAMEALHIESAPAAHSNATSERDEQETPAGTKTSNRDA